MNFFNLHVHSQYSFLDGMGTPQQWSDRLREIGQDGIAITDHGNIFGHAPFAKHFKKEGLHMVFGCEFYMVEEAKKERGYYHATVLAKNAEGYQNLLWLANESYKQFYYKPRITVTQLLEHSAGLVVLSGCSMDSIFLKNTATDKSKFFAQTVKRFKNMEWYVEIQPFKDSQAQWDFLTSQAARHGIPCIVTADCHYPAEKHKTTQDLMLAINMAKKDSDPDRLKMEYPLFIPSADTILARCVEMGMDWDVAIETMQRCYDVWHSCKVELPKTGLVKIGYSNADIRKACYAGLKRLDLDKDAAYTSRLDYELKLIADKGYNDYFYIIADLMKWAKSKMLCGAGRGSSAGSLACYCLAITEVDPIKHNLMFERFIDVTRKDLPDIDLDFPSSKREEVIKYLKDKYGEENTSQLINFNTYKPKAIIQDAGRTLNIPPWETKQATTQIVDRSGGDARANFCLRDSIEQFDKLKALFVKYPRLEDAIDLEGQARGIGKHAAAVIISRDPLRTIGAVNQDGNFSMDKKSAEEHGLLKIDVLGVSTLDMLMDVCEEVDMDYHALYDLPLDDTLTFERVFTPGKLQGIFQFEGLEAKRVCQQVRPTTFEQLVHITSLSRPGTLNSHTTSAYIYKTHGKQLMEAEFERVDPALEPYTGETLGFILFQEQVMQVVRNIGKFDWDGVSYIRKMMSKSMGEEAFNKYKADFLKGANADGLSQERAEFIWKQCYTHGSWSFNKSHAVSYSYLSYWCGYMKAHYPAQFFARILRDKMDEAEIKPILKEWDREFLPIDLNRSKKYFSADGDTLIGGFVNLPGIGETTADKIIDAQPFESVEDFKSRVPKGLATKVLAALENGIEWANTQRLSERYAEQLKAVKLTGELTTCEDIIQTKATSGIVLAKVTQVNLRNSNDPDRVAKRGGKLRKGFPEYVILLIKDEDENVGRVYCPNKMVETHKQELMDLTDKIVLFKFKMNADSLGEVFTCEKYKVFDNEGK